MCVRTDLCMIRNLLCRNTGCKRAWSCRWTYPIGMFLIQSRSLQLSKKAQPNGNCLVNFLLFTFQLLFNAMPRKPKVPLATLFVTTKGIMKKAAIMIEQKKSNKIKIVGLQKWKSKKKKQEFALLYVLVSVCISVEEYKNKWQITKKRVKRRSSANHNRNHLPTYTHLHADRHTCKLSIFTVSSLSFLQLLFVFLNYDTQNSLVRALFHSLSNTLV